MKYKWNIYINGSIHKEDRHRKPLDTLTIKKIHKAKIRRYKRENKKYIIIERHINISVEF